MSTTFIPVGKMMIPIHQKDPDPARCPSCKQLESTVVVCTRCGYKYPKESPEENMRLNDYLCLTGAWILLFAILWLCLTLMTWLGGDISLQENLREQKAFGCDVISAVTNWAQNIKVFEAKEKP